MAYTVAVAAAGKERPSATAAKIKTASHTKFRTLPWQVADELRIKVYQLTGRTPASRDFKFCDQLRDAIDGVPANIAQGFRRKSSIDCARFVTYALTGMDETEERLADGVKRGHWTTEDLAITNRLLRRLTKGLTNYQAYLLSEEGIKRWRMLYEARHKRRIRRSPPNP